MGRLNFREEISKIAKIIADKYQPEKIILFGSFAWGKPHKYSDADFLIIKESDLKSHQRIGEVYSILFKNYEYNLPVDVVVYTPSEFKKRLGLGDFFVKEILSKGKLLYEKSSS